MKNWDRDNRISTFIRNCRKDRGLTQERFAHIAGVGIRFVRDLEQGKPNKDMTKVDQLLAFFGHELVPLPRAKTSR